MSKEGPVLLCKVFMQSKFSRLNIGEGNRRHSFPIVDWKITRIILVNKYSLYYGLQSGAKRDKYRTLY